jgi:hypothetical protein
MTSDANAGWNVTTTGMGAGRYTVVEKLLEGKLSDPALCEDAIVLGETCCAVIDGATNVDTRYPDGRTPGRVAVDVISEEISRIGPNDSAREALLRVDAAIADWYRETGMTDQAREEPDKRASASIAMVHIPRRELWMLGDCQALVAGRVITNGKRVDELLSEVRAFVLEAERAAGATEDELCHNDPGRAAILDLIRLQRRFQNRGGASAYDYYVLDGFLPADAPVSVTPLPTEPVDLVLASDGYPSLHPTLDETESALDLVLTADPLLCSAFSSTKGVYPGATSFDDRAYLRILLP